MLDICLLGTGGMMPMPSRFLTAMLARLNGRLALIDCGEGTQVTMKMLGWGFKAVSYTHLSVPSGSVVNLVVSSGADTQENENNKPSSNTQTQGTKYFTINAPSGSEGSVYVRVVKEDADGVYPVVDTYRDASEFPYSVSVTGKGSGTVTCYIDNVQQWSQSVNFSG